MKPTDGSDERQFLHDLASPLGTAVFLLDIVIEDLKARLGAADSEELKHLATIHQQMERMRQMLGARRQLLIDRGVPSAKE